MRDTNLVNSLREHAEWARENEWETPITLGDDLTEAADRLENQNAHIAVLQKEIEKLRGQNEQLREAAELVAKESAELLERRWIPVEERLPENGVPVLINYIASDGGKYNPDGTAVWTDYGCFWWEGSLEDCDTEVAVPITHWMPLPEPPEEVRRWND